MTVLQRDIAAYEKARARLEADHSGDWALFYAGALIEVFSDFEEAATEAVDRFENGPYLIRQIGVEQVPVSSTMVFRPSHAHSASGV